MTLNSAEPPGTWERWGWLMAVVWMVFLYYPVLALLESETSPAWRGAGWAGLGVFAVAYVAGFVMGMRRGWRSPNRFVWGCFVIIILAATVTIPAIGWQVASFFPFIMAYAAYGISTLWHWIATLASLTLISVAIVFAVERGTPAPWSLLVIILMMATVNTVNTWLIDRSVSADELRLELATSEERSSIARDVHDFLGHSLTTVKLKAELAAKVLPHDPERARKELDDIITLTGDAIAGVRRTVTGIRSGTLASHAQASRDSLESAGVHVTLTGTTEALSEAQAIPAGWILTEATTNILRHASATRVRIAFEPGEMSIEDNGVGIGDTTTTDGNGLRSMRERAAQAGATLTLHSPGTWQSGTLVSVTW